MLLGGSEYGRPRRVAWTICLIVLLTSSFGPLSATPLPTSTEDYQIQVHENSTSEPLQNATSNDLYIIRAVVYEIGILTDADNTTSESTETHEEVNIAFYDPPHKDNGQLDLSNMSISDSSTFNSQDTSSQNES